MPITSIEAVVKVTERCNIACTYCYMFYKGNDDYTRHPKYISPETTLAVSQFLRDGARDLGAGTVFVDLHGGEPLMLGYRRFDELCQTLHDVISPVARVQIRLQTNATLISPEWVPIFAKHRIGVGVSIDGDRVANDTHRVDHRGNSTYERTVAGLTVLQNAARAGLISDPGVLCVATPGADGAATYRHFVDKLGARALDFLLPMDSHDDCGGWSPGEIAKYYQAVVREWIRDDDPTVDLRFLNRFIEFFQQAPSVARQIEFYDQNVLITVASNGDVGPDDDLKPLNLYQGLANVSTTTLRDYLGIEAVKQLNAEYFRLPDACGGCEWAKYCRGCGGTGRIINRYKAATEFNNPSVFCADLQEMYRYQLDFLLRSGYPIQKAVDALGLSDEVAA